MNSNSPVYTRENECQDCYKCIRHCPTKSISIVNGRAAVIPEQCIACGHCVQVCPAHAKVIRDDVPYAKHLLKSKEKTIISLAPSWLEKYSEHSKQAFISALKKLGFYGVSETALGAQQVTTMTQNYLNEHGKGIFLSSACPVAIEYLGNTFPDHHCSIIPVLSPLLTHCQLLRNKYGSDIGIVFVGPCIAKKKEADNYPDLLNVALTFEELDCWLQEEDIAITANENDANTFIPHSAEEGTLYSIEGGMLTALEKDRSSTVLLTLSGLDNIGRVLTDVKNQDINDQVFIELLACQNGCIGGPGIGQKRSCLEGMIDMCKRTKEQQPKIIKRPLEVKPRKYQIDNYQAYTEISDKALDKALTSIGKHTLKDELNCGGCGYQTCKSFAKAIIQGKAEPAMCVSYMRQLAQKKANALIKYIPAGVVIADEALHVIECNKHFSKLFDQSTQLAYDVCPGLAGVDISKLVPFYDLFRTALATGNDIYRQNYLCDNKIYDINLFSIEKKHVIGAIIQDVTSTEIHREHISERAREVIKKNISTVQTIANCLGEHMAATEILLREVASKYKVNTPNQTRNHDQQ